MSVFMRQYRIVQYDPKGAYSLYTRTWFRPFWVWLGSDFDLPTVKAKAETHKQYGSFAISVEEL